MKYMITAFILGIIFTLLVLSLVNNGKELPFSIFSSNANLSTPSDSIKASQIHVYENAIVIDVEDASLGRYAATGSMIPILNENSNGIRVSVKSADEINVGDIITFKEGSDLIVHRVIEKSSDEQGVYFITKGDNSPSEDGKIRMNQIVYKTIGVLW